MSILWKFITEYLQLVHFSLYVIIKFKNIFEKTKHVEAIVQRPVEGTKMWVAHILNFKRLIKQWER